MIDTNEQKDFFTRFFSETEVANWEEILVNDSGQRFKSYPRLPKRPLPAPVSTFSFPLGQALVERKSAQEFKCEQFTLSDLSIFLAAVGLRPENSTAENTRRTYPSAGARYPGEAYVISVNCEGIQPGLYHYSINEHELEELLIKDFRESLVEATNDSRVRSASVVLIFSIVFGRIAEKYGTRGLRYGLIELGHMAQNICLTARALEKGCCEIGGFVDSTVNTWLDIDTESEAAGLLLILGGEAR